MKFCAFIAISIFCLFSLICTIVCVVITLVFICSFTYRIYYIASVRAVTFTDDF